MARFPRKRTFIKSRSLPWAQPWLPLHHAGPSPWGSVVFLRTFCVHSTVETHELLSYVSEAKDCGGKSPRPESRKPGPRPSSTSTVWPEGSSWDGFRCHGTHNLDHLVGLLEGKQDKIMEPKIRHKCDYFLRTIKRNRNRLPILKPLTNTANITKPGQIVVLPAQHTCIVLFLKKYYLSQFYTD